MVALPLATGWYLTRKEHVPKPQPGTYKWGVQRYASFLELWCFTLIVLVGAITALWIHTLVRMPLRTNGITSMLGFGALFGALGLVWRFISAARELRSRCEEEAAASSDWSDLPSPPLEGLLSGRIWEPPGLLLAAGGIVWWPLEQAGAGELIVVGE